MRELTCLEEEHTHDDSCFDEDGVTFICDKFEHTHDDSCYTTTYELVCGLEEGELVEEVNPIMTRWPCLRSRWPQSPWWSIL